MKRIFLFHVFMFHLLMFPTFLLLTRRDNRC
jgi:hypothetical protein